VAIIRAHTIEAAMERAEEVDCCTGKEMSVLKTSKRLLPYEPGYTRHWEAEKRRKETKAWLRQRECDLLASRECAAPSIVPDKPELDRVISSKRR
jgi:hypothetical protein